MPPPHYSLLRLEALAPLAALVALLLASALASAAVGRRLLSRLLRPRRLLAGEVGSAELDFALAFPIFMALVAVTVQFALMLNAQVVVDYAAFCAARSFSVWVGEPILGEGQNHVRGDAGSVKRARARSAASIACAPISPRWSVLRVGVGPMPSPVDERDFHRALQTGLVPEVDTAWLTALAFDKLRYAQAHTRISLSRPTAASGAATGIRPGEPIEVRVEYDLELAVPFAGGAFGRAFGRRSFGGYALPLTAQYTLATWGYSEARSGG